MLKNINCLTNYSNDCLNLYKNYKSGQSLVTGPTIASVAYQIRHTTVIKIYYYACAIPR